MKHDYILIDDVMERTGFSKKQLMNLSLNGNFSFYMYNSSGWIKVSKIYIGEMYYSRLNKQFSYSQYLDGDRDHLDYDMLHMRDKDVEQLPTINNSGETCNKCDLTSSQIILPINHEYVPYWLKVAMECWENLYRNAGAEGKKIRKKEIKKWIQTNYPDIANNGREQIASIVNPFKKGGATPT